jgi:hypothetical protein
MAGARVERSRTYGLFVAAHELERLTEHHRVRRGRAEANPFDATGRHGPRP